MAEVYLHIGTQKTGTTALQEFFSINRDALLSHDLFYPSAEEYLIMPGIHRTRNGIWVNRSYKTPQYDTYMDTLMKHCSSCERVLLSDEDLYLAIRQNPDKLHEFNRALKKRKISLKVIIYLRRQDEYLSSLWAHQVKVNCTLTFQEWLADRNAYLWGDYCSFLDTLSGELGHENVLVRPYERDRFHGGSIYTDMLELFGLELSPDLFIPEEDYNPSLSDVCLEVRRRLNTMPGAAVIRSESETDPASFRRSRLIKKALMQVQRDLREEGLLKHRSFFREGEREELLSRFSEGNALIGEKYLKGEMLFHSKPSTDDKAESPITESEIENVYQRMLLTLGTLADEASVPETPMVGNLTADELIQRQKETIRSLEEQMRLRNIPKLIWRNLQKRR